MSSNNTNFTSFEASHLATTIATAVILGLFFVSFVFLLFCRFIFETASRTNSSYSTPDNNSAKNAMRGLDPLIKDMYPTFLYSAVKGCKQGLECSICLSEMEESDMLRLLTVCCHVFHRTCIDEWFETRTTCPICRSDVSNPEKEHNMCPLLMFQVNENDEDENENDDVALTVEGGQWEVEKGNATAEQRRIPKAHSTGHSIVLIKEDKDDDDDKYKLMLTDTVRAEIIKGHQCARSCTVFGNFSSSRNDKPHRSRGDSIP